MCTARIHVNYELNFVISQADDAARFHLLCILFILYVLYTYLCSTTLYTWFRMIILLSHKIDRCMYCTFDIFGMRIDCRTNALTIILDILNAEFALYLNLYYYSLDSVRVLL